MKSTDKTQDIYFTMHEYRNISLKPYNTFHVDVVTNTLFKVDTPDDLINFIRNKENSLPFYILGGGSNVLFTKNYPGTILKNEIKGIEIIKETEEYVYIKAYGGENWHEFVLYTLNNGFYGLENLSLIPGTVGAAPMQNIGAYGVEIQDYFDSLEAVHLDTGEIHTFDKKSCEFGYRSSIFKTKARNSYFILSVTFRLNKTPILNTSYGAIENELSNRNITSPTPKDVSDVVISIRQSKLPDPDKIGNGGSFFKNPVIPIEKYVELKKAYPDIPGYFQNEVDVKVPAGWLIDKAGWKGFRDGDSGVHDKQALVLINYGSAKGNEIKNLSEKIEQSIADAYGIELTTEVNII